MSELTIPDEADEPETRELVRKHVAVGDEVQIGNNERGGGSRIDVTGEVTGIESGYVELDGHPPEGKSVRYDQIGTVTIVSRN